MLKRIQEPKKQMYEHKYSVQHTTTRVWDKPFMLQQHCEIILNFKVLLDYIEKLEPSDKYIKKCELRDLYVNQNMSIIKLCRK